MSQCLPARNSGWQNLADISVFKQGTRLAVEPLPAETFASQANALTATVRAAAAGASLRVCKFQEGPKFGRSRFPQLYASVTCAVDDACVGRKIPKIVHSCKAIVSDV